MPRRSQDPSSANLPDSGEGMSGEDADAHPDGDAHLDGGDGAAADTERADPAAGTGSAPDLSALPIAGLTRRRMTFLAAALVSVWIVIVFARQAGDAAAASARVDSLRSANMELVREVADYERELELIQRQAYIVQQARAYGLGEPNDVPFTLMANAPPLPPDAPGSASVRLGSEAATMTPLESWLSLLFGPGR